MRRVQLLRFLQALQVIARLRYENQESSSLNEITTLLNAHIAREEGQWWIQLMLNRMKDIAKTIEECNLCKVEREVILFGRNFDVKWKEWQSAVSQDLLTSKREEWWAVHQFLFCNHRVYKRFYNIVKEEEYIRPTFVAKSLGLKSIEHHPTVDVLKEWGLKLGRLQRNTLTGLYYVLREPNLEGYPSLQDFGLTLCEAYVKIQKEERQHVVSLPKVQELVCQHFRIKRSNFSSLLEKLHQENLGSIFLESGIIPSYAYGSIEERKQILKLDAIQSQLWFETRFFYTKEDWEDIEIDNQVKRFIRTTDDLLMRFGIDAKRVNTP